MRAASFWNAVMIRNRTASSVTLPLLVAICSIAGCGEPAREDVIQRFAGGEKQVVAKYEGSGSDERMVERRTFDVSGELILLEYLESGQVLTWAELQTDLDTPDGLREAMQGAWYSYSLEGEAANPFQAAKFTMTLEGEHYRGEGSHKFLILDDDDWSEPRAESGRFEFIGNSSVRLIQDADEKSQTAESESQWPRIENTLRIQFDSAGSFTTEVTTLVDGRIIVGPALGSRFYRTQRQAEEASAEWLATTSDRREADRKMRAAAVQGDEILMSEYPEFYKAWVGEE